MKKFINPEIEVVELHKSFQINTAYAGATGGPMDCGDYDPNCDCDCNSVGNWDFDEMD